MGVSCIPGAMLAVTDMDAIERSNLNRHGLASVLNGQAAHRMSSRQQNAERSSSYREAGGQLIGLNHRAPVRCSEGILKTARHEAGVGSHMDLKAVPHAIG